ncbi:uncharacterized protein LOC114527671 [Dendronephthya gigantea]|uniref:uncharacterized protein LOC114527671 n=1 Tax=Dendronephthya gigantea TaxID=151771 RepID=UPI00106D4A90|nr:uncharacterized protein LOC114527671 [Dendronephthya gigantea]
MRVICTLVLLFVASCSTAFKLLTNNVNDKEHPKGFGTARHAVIIGIDGFGGEYLRNVSGQLPAIQTFFDYGAFSTKARNIAPTISAPNWAGYLTSMDVTQSGVYSNYWTDVDGNPPGEAGHLPPVSGRGRPQTIFSAIKEQDPSAKTWILYTWNWFTQIAKNNPHVDHWYKCYDPCRPGESAYDCENRQDWDVTRRTVEAIQNDKPTLTFVHFDAVDDAGHRTHWGSDVYYEIVRQKDVQVATILNTLATTKTSSGNSMLDETIVVIIADHGGYRNGHDWTPPFIAEVHVPLLFKGPGIKNVDMDKLDYRDISSLDMPVTVLNALGIEPGKYMRGRVLEEMYD